MTKRNMRKLSPEQLSWITEQEREEIFRLLKLKDRGALYTLLRTKEAHPAQLQTLSLAMQVPGIMERIREDIRLNPPHHFAWKTMEQRSVDSAARKAAQIKAAEQKHMKVGQVVKLIEGLGVKLDALIEAVRDQNSTMREVWTSQEVTGE